MTRDESLLKFLVENVMEQEYPEHKLRFEHGVEQWMFDPLKLWSDVGKLVAKAQELYEKGKAPGLWAWSINLTRLSPQVICKDIADAFGWEEPKEETIG